MSKTQITAEPGTPQIVVTREFDAPRELVFRAHTEPDLLVRWLGPRDLALAIDRYEVRDGGIWHYTNTDEQGNTYGFRGVFHGDPSPDAIVNTFEFDGAPGHVSLETATFTEHDGKTLVRTVSTFQSVDDRDAAIGSGMERGIHESHARLGELLAELS